jgi:hypothetical protein
MAFRLQYLPSQGETNMLNALITSLVVATSVTHPVVSVNQPTYTVTTKSEPCEVPTTPALQAVQSRVRKVEAHRWEQLGADVSLRGRDVITLGRQAGGFTSVELENVSGRSSIQTVTITYGNGERQVFHPGELDASKSVISIDLDGKARYIDHITITGQSMRHSSFKVLGHTFNG